MDKSKISGHKVKKPGKQERSWQSTRECRMRKKLRYQYLEDLVSSREKAICALREEPEMYNGICRSSKVLKISTTASAELVRTC
uniref:cAMP-responsive element-binding protein-like 2 n=1 Tax=Pseudonaja textilis TaxID=8673 RepID=A0A670Z9V6_PSETE